MEDCWQTKKTRIITGLARRNIHHESAHHLREISITAAGRLRLTHSLSSERANIHTQHSGNLKLYSTLLIYVSSETGRQVSNQGWSNDATADTT